MLLLFSNYIVFIFIIRTKGKYTDFFNNHCFDTKTLLTAYASHLKAQFSITFSLVGTVWHNFEHLTFRNKPIPSPFRAFVCLFQDWNRSAYRISQKKPLIGFNLTLVI